MESELAVPSSSPRDHLHILKMLLMQFLIKTLQGLPIDFKSHRSCLQGHPRSVPTRFRPSFPPFPSLFLQSWVLFQQHKNVKSILTPGPLQLPCLCP